MKPPPWLNDPCSLVLVDWSWWCQRAVHGRDGIDGMLSLVVGWLCQMLAFEPAHLAICLDSPGETWRHRLRHPLDPEWRYKANRAPKSEEFFNVSRHATRIAELHGIPILWADAYEADDVIATAVAQARAAGYRVWIASADKDLHHLVEADTRSGLIVGTWNPFESDSWTYRTPVEVFATYGVRPEQIPDWLAICGDTSDGVPGIEHGIGATRAAAILAEHGTLAAALEAPVWSTAKGEEIEAEIKALAKVIAKKTGSEAQAARERREGLMLARRVAGWHLTLHAHAAVARFSRELTVLDCDAPINLPWEELPLGGYDVAELRAAYLKLGWTAKAAQVPHRTKRAAWQIPWQAGGAPAPRRIDGPSKGDDAGDGSGRGDAGGRVGGRLHGGAGAAARGGGGDQGPGRGAGTEEQHPDPRGAAGAGGAAAPVVTPLGCCSYSGCATDPVHQRFTAATLAIRDSRREPGRR